MGPWVPRAVLVQLSGLLLGAAVCIPIYFLLVSTHGVSTMALPTPTAQQFKAVALMASQGLEGLPPGAALAKGLTCGVGMLVSVLSRGRWARGVPSASAMGIGFFLPLFLSLTLCLGALLALLVGRLRPSATQTVQTAGAGAIVAESLLGVLIPLLRLLGILK